MFEKSYSTLSLDEEYTSVYNKAYMQAENDLISLGELSDSSLGIKYCQQFASKAVLEHKIKKASLTPGEDKGIQKKKSPGLAFVKKALTLKQLASSNGQDEIFENIRVAMLLAWSVLYPGSQEKLIISDTDWIGENADIAQDFLDMSIKDLVESFVSKAREEGTISEVSEALLKAALKNARVAKKIIASSPIPVENAF